MKKLADEKLVQAADGTGLPPLHKAIILGHSDIVKDLAKSFRGSLKLTDNVSPSIMSINSIPHQGSKFTLHQGSTINY